MRIATGLVCLIALLLPAAPQGQSGKLPAPAGSFGFQPGADFKLATYDQSIDYFKKLDAASKFLTLVQAGRTSQGRPMYFALISSSENLSRIDRYREIARRLAHPGGLTEAEARQLAARGRMARPCTSRRARRRVRRATSSAASRTTRSPRSCSRSR